jgi:membrane-associated phospholipid phosphatase
MRARLQTRVAQRLRLRPGPPGARSWVDVLFVAWLGWLYDPINNLAAVRQRLAESNARGLLHVERSLHLAPERSLNRWLAAHHTLSQVTVFWYENVHGVVLIAAFVLLWWLRPDLLRRLRAVLAIVSLAALAVFWSYPVAPPRMLVTDGYVDLVAIVDHQPVWHAGAVSVDSNQLAAFPSLHLAWGVWASLTLWAMTRRRWLRALAVAYPVVTLFAVMATGNHFLLDAVAGTLLTLLVAALASRLAAWRRGRPAAPQPAVARRSAA